MGLGLFEVQRRILPTRAQAPRLCASHLRDRDALAKASRVPAEIHCVLPVRGVAPQGR